MTAKLTVTYDPALPPVATLFVLALPREKNALSLEVKTGGGNGKSDCCCTATLNTEGAEEGEAGSSSSTVSGSDFEVAAALCNSLPFLRPCTLGAEEQFWAKFSEVLSQQPKLLKTLDEHLRLRTFLSGHALSLADVAVFAAIVTLLGAQNLDKPFPQTSELRHFNRWLRLMRSTNPIAAKTMKAIASAFPGKLGKPQQPSDSVQPCAAAKAGGKGSAATGAAGGVKAPVNLYEGKLPGAVKGQVVTRFPPEPSGYLHIGHAKAALLNDYYARSYEGKLIIRFDDTNPVRESQEFESSILDDLKLLGIEPSQPVTHTSDYFEQLQELCEKLIKQGVFYCDDTPLEQMRHERGEGIESKCRGNSVEENLRRWQEMKKGSAEGERNCVRAKIDMCSKNKCMRDPVMYRTCLSPPHHRHGTKYKVYPMYDFACPVVDALEGVTHAMRTNEYADRIPQYEWVTAATGMRPVTIYEFSRLNFVHTVLSKRKLQWLVDTGVVSGWDDPRFPTVRGILRRGLTVQALKDFLFEQGPSKNANLMEWDKLWTRNKQIIDPVVPRFMGVAVKQAVPLRLHNGPKAVEMRERQLHPKNPAVGMGRSAFSSSLLLEVEDAAATKEGEEFTLMRWCNAVVQKVQRAEDGKVIALEAVLNPDGDFKKTERKLHWICNPEPEASFYKVPEGKGIVVLLREYLHLITKPKPEDDDTMESIVNRNSLLETEALVEQEVAKLNVGDMLQLERRGYYRVDGKPEGQPVVLVKIPDGKAKPMSVITS